MSTIASAKAAVAGAARAIARPEDTIVAIKMISRIAALIFVTEGCIMLALDNFHVDWPAIREALIDATTLTIIVAPVTYYFMIKPFIVRASIANADVQAQADRLNAALADLTVQKRILDNHCLVTRTDVDGNITYANDEFCRLSGYAREEVLGKNHRILKSGNE